MDHNPRAFWGWGEPPQGLQMADATPGSSRCVNYVCRLVITIVIIIIIIIVIINIVYLDPGP